MFTKNACQTISRKETRVAKTNIVKRPEDAIEEGTKALVPIRQRALDFLEKAKAITKIRTQPERQAVALLLVTNKDLQAEIRRVFKPMKEATHAAHQQVCDQETEQLADLMAEERKIKTMQNEDFREQERVAEEKRRKLQAEADAKAEAERKKEVAALKKSGQKEEAAALAEAPVQAAPVQVENKAQATAAASGLTFRIQKHMEIVDESLLERKYLQVNTAAIQAAGAAYWETIKPKDPKDVQQYAVAVAKFSQFHEVAGVRFWVTKESADTGRRA